MWGLNTCYEILNGSTPDQCTPFRVGSFGTSAPNTLILGSETTGGLDPSMNLYMTGCNTMGEIGDGSTAPQTSVYQVIIGSKTIQGVASGGLHTGAYCTDGSLYLWGSNSHGQIGDGTTTDRTSPTAAVWSYGTITSLTLGDVHSVALTSSGLYTWGGGSYCQLGTGTTADIYSPGFVMVGGHNLTVASAGGRNTGAVTTSGALYVWGDNSAGQLGNGAYATACTAGIISVAGKTVVAFAFGDDMHACARTSDNDLYCWGDNAFGQIGDSTLTTRTLPTLVLTNVQVFALGYGMTGAIRTDSLLSMWGLNTDCSVGDGTVTNRSTPTQILGRASMLVCGYYHCAAYLS
jgi:alpha-tubulin suppressor-like RCC1 family protein